MVGIIPFLGSIIIKVIRNNNEEVQEDVMVRLQRSIVSKLDSDSNNVCKKLNCQWHFVCGICKTVRPGTLSVFQQVNCFLRSDNYAGF